MKSIILDLIKGLLYCVLGVLLTAIIGGFLSYVLDFSFFRESQLKNTLPYYIIILIGPFLEEMIYRLPLKKNTMYYYIALYLFLFSNVSMYVCSRIYTFNKMGERLFCTTIVFVIVFWLFQKLKKMKINRDYLLSFLFASMISFIHLCDYKGLIFHELKVFIQYSSFVVFYSLIYFVILKTTKLKDEFKLVLMSSMIFALSHISNFLPFDNIKILLFSFILVFPQFIYGLVLGNIRMNHGIFYAIILHMVINGIGFIIKMQV